jgi:hypothetical protein
MDHHQVDNANDNKQVTVLQPHHFQKLTVTAWSTTQEASLEDCIRQASVKEAKVVDALKSLHKIGPQKLADGGLEWEEEDGLVYHKGRLYVPDGDCQKEVLQQCHNAPTAGHPGRAGTLELATQHYWWPGLSRYVGKYVAGCKSCQQNKAAQHPKARLQPLEVPSGPWQVIGVDLITGLPVAKGHNAIITYVDHYTSMTHVLPTSDTVDAASIADIHMPEIFRLHSIPKAFVSD